MKALLALILLLALLGCERKVLSDEDRARNAVVEWIDQNAPDWVKAAEKSYEVSAPESGRFYIRVKGSTDHSIASLTDEGAWLLFEVPLFDVRVNGQVAEIVRTPKEFFPGPDPDGL